MSWSGRILKSAREFCSMHCKLFKVLKFAVGEVLSFVAGGVCFIKE